MALVALTGHLIEFADPDRISQLLKRLPAGVVVLWAIAVGSIAYLMWRLLEALSDPYSQFGGGYGFAVRAYVAFSGLAYGTLAYSAARTALAPAPESPDASEQQRQLLVDRVLDWPGGTWLVAAAGMAVLAVAAAQFWMVLRRSYTSEIQMQPRSRAAKTTLTILGAYGYCARGVLFAVLGYLFVRGAMSHDPSAVGDMDTAFDTIGGGVVGDTAFAVVAAGIVAYGVFMYANAWLYKFETGS